MTDRDDIRTARGRLNMTQEQLAAELGVKLKTVHRWETGLSDPKRIVFLALRWVQYENGVET